VEQSDGDLYAAVRPLERDSGLLICSQTPAALVSLMRPGKPASAPERYLLPAGPGLLPALFREYDSDADTARPN